MPDPVGDRGRGAEERPGCIILCITDTHIQNLYQEWEDLKETSEIGEFVLFCIDQAYKDEHMDKSLSSPWPGLFH